MILLIDNYDSFSYNLYQLVGSMESDIHVVRNDEITVKEIKECKPTHIILSPGPGRPEQAGSCIEIVRELAGVIPILGVCLGHQAICAAFGVTISYAGKVMHGKASRILITKESSLFSGLPYKIEAGRYHSLVAVSETIPKELAIIAEDEMGEVMAVEGIGNSLFGVQFHPESILTPKGKMILCNFLKEGRK